MGAYDRVSGTEWLWYPHDGPLPLTLVKAIKEREFIVAQNARFDQLIWEFVAVSAYNFPQLPAEKWYCSAAQCRVNAIPSGLDNASLFVTGSRGKLSNGKALIKLLSIPNADGSFNEDPVALRQMGEYCLQDVRATEEVIASTRPMTANEHSDWLVSEKINDRGFKADLELAQLCSDQAEEELGELSTVLNELTNGAVTAVSQVARVKKWFMVGLSPDVIEKYLTRTVVDKKTKKESVKVSFDKGARAGLLAAFKHGQVNLTNEQAEVLSIVEEGNKSSVSKFKKFILLADEYDHRIRGAYMFAGASQTKRFSAKGLQPHNFRRECIKANRVEHAKEMLRKGQPHQIEDGTGVMDVLSKLLRPTIMPEKGHRFIVGDWSAIEAMVLPWLADSRGGEKVLDVFRSGRDIYVETAKGMGMTDRQIGKVATLALGFQGGVNAFQVMARAYGLHITDDEAQEIVDAWREANPWAVAFWRQLDMAALNAVKYPSVWYSAGKLKYIFMSDLLGGTLLCQLPDESVIQYPQARIDMIETPWGALKPAVTYAKAGILPKAGEAEWPRSTLYAGLACENGTQATAASILRDALFQCDTDETPVVLHVHDEIILEVPTELAQTSKSILQDIMETPPEWATGLPLKAEPNITTRYGK